MRPILIYDKYLNKIQIGDSGSPNLMFEIPGIEIICGAHKQ